MYAESLEKFKKVEEAVNIGLSVNEACKSIGLAPSTYYTAKRQGIGPVHGRTVRKHAHKPKYEEIVLPREITAPISMASFKEEFPKGPEKLFYLSGTPEMLARFIHELSVLYGAK